MGIRYPDRIADRVPFRGEVLGPMVRELPQQMGPYYETRGERFMGPSAQALALQYAPRAVAERGEMATPFSAFVGPDRASMPRINPDPRRFVPPGGWRGEVSLQHRGGDPFRMTRHLSPIDPIGGAAGWDERQVPFYPETREEYNRMTSPYIQDGMFPMLRGRGVGVGGRSLQSRPVVLPPVEPLPEMPGFRTSLR